MAVGELGRLGVAARRAECLLRALRGEHIERTGASLHRRPPRAHYCRAQHEVHQRAHSGRPPGEPAPGLAGRRVGEPGAAATSGASAAAAASAAPGRRPQRPRAPVGR